MIEQSVSVFLGWWSKRDLWGVGWRDEVQLSDIVQTSRGRRRRGIAAYLELGPEPQ